MRAFYMRNIVAILSIALVLTCVAAMAKPAVPAPKVAVVALTAAVVNNVVVVTATTVKQGKVIVSESWTGVSSSTAAVKQNTNYVATGSLAPGETGTYPVTYKILMGAGKSSVQFVGEASLLLDVTVDGDGNVSLN